MLVWKKVTTRLRSCQDFPSPWYMLVGKKVAKRLHSCEDHPSPSKYVSKERSGYVVTWLRSDLKLYYISLFFNVVSGQSVFVTLCSFCRFSGIIICGPNHSEKNRHLCRWDECIRHNPSQNGTIFMKSEHIIKQAVTLSSPVSMVYARNAYLHPWLHLVQGHLSASLYHKTVFMPSSQSVKGHYLHVFIGAYKILSHVLPDCSDIVNPLECTLTVCKSTDKLMRDKNLTLRFKTAQEYLSKHKSIHQIPFG